MKLSPALIFIFSVVEFFFATCAAMGVSFTNAARGSNSVSQSVPFRVHQGVNIVSHFLLKVDNDSAFCSIGERIPFEELCVIKTITHERNFKKLLVNNFFTK